MRSRLTAKLLLFAFAANVALCPCAPLAGEMQLDRAAQSAISSDDVDHSTHHPAELTNESVDHLQADCHTDSPAEECGMLAGLDLDGGIDRADLTAAAAPYSHGVVAESEVAGSDERLTPYRWRPPDTPIARFDRLLT